MKRMPSIVWIVALLMGSFACHKKTEEVAAPVEAAEPAEVEEPQQIEREEPPVIEVEEEPEADVFDPSKYQLDDVYFDFDKSDLRDDTRQALNRYAQVLKANSDLMVLVEGHCDERGTEEYNMGLGERRASRVFDYLVSLGVSAGRMDTISYGELRPKSMGHNEEVWAQNRRAHFKLSRR